MERVLGLEHPAMLFCASTLGEALVRQHKSEQAIELSKQLEEHARKLFARRQSLDTKVRQAA